MTTSKLQPVQLLTASFAAGIAGAVIYNKYLTRVQQETTNGRRTRTTRRGEPSNIDPFTALLNQNDIGTHILNHLTRVYAALGGTSLAAALGAWLQIQTQFSTSFASLISLGLAFSLQFSKPQLWKLLAFGAFSGAGLGGLVQTAVRLHPSLLPLALGSTTAIFASFAAAATLSTRRSMLYLYGALGSALSLLSLSSFANLFVQNRHLFNLNLFGGLAMFMGYVVADSQLIIERADQGDEDYVSHAWLLFTDLNGIFTRILIILMKQQAEEEQKRKKKKGGKDEFYD